MSQLTPDVPPEKLASLINFLERAAIDRNNTAEVVLAIKCDAADATEMAQEMAQAYRADAGLLKETADVLRQLTVKPQEAAE